MASALGYLSSLFTEKRKQIQEWIGSQSCCPLLYNSSDIRCNGFKVAPVDNNVFSSGFNNFNSAQVEFAARQVVVRYPDKKRVLVIGEPHTRNPAYTENLRVLSKIFDTAGMRVQVSTLRAVEGNGASTAPVGCGDGWLRVGDYVPDLIVLNDAMIEREPLFLKQVKFQVIVPSVQLGWFRRRKHEYFKYYDQLAKEFAE